MSATSMTVNFDADFGMAGEITELNMDELELVTGGIWVYALVFAAGVVAGHSLGW